MLISWQEAAPWSNLRGLVGLAGPFGYPAPLTPTTVTHLDWGQQQRINTIPRESGSWWDSPAGGPGKLADEWYADGARAGSGAGGQPVYQPPPDAWRDVFSGPSPGMDSRTQQQTAWEAGTTVKRDYTDVIRSNMDARQAREAQELANGRASREADPLARARTLEDARAYGAEAARLDAGGPVRPGLPVKRSVQWQDVTSVDQAEIQQREMERRGVKILRSPGWEAAQKKAQAEAQAERVRAARAAQAQAKAQATADRERATRENAAREAAREQAAKVARDEATLARAFREQAAAVQRARDQRAKEAARDQRAREAARDAENAARMREAQAASAQATRDAEAREQAQRERVGQYTVTRAAQLARTAFGLPPALKAPVNQNARQATLATQYRPGQQTALPLATTTFTVMRGLGGLAAWLVDEA